MAYTKDIDDCNTYFGATNHVKAEDWSLYESNEKSAAFAQAKRELELYFNMDLFDPSATDKYRCDYAHYEQTLFILEQTNRTRQSETSAETIITADTARRDTYTGVTIAPQAMRFLGITRGRIVRG